MGNKWGTGDFPSWPPARLLARLKFKMVFMPRFRTGLYYDGAYSMPSTLGMGGKCRYFVRPLRLYQGSAHHQK